MSDGDNSETVVAVRPLNILVAEDNAINQVIIMKLLDSMGHKVELTANGQEACDALTSGNFDLIIMDVHMPIVDGLLATRVIRGSGNGIPIIGCTADSFPDQVEEFKQLGMNDVVVKPIHRHSLFVSINKVMDEDIHLNSDMSKLTAGPDMYFT